jgi:cyclopropane-fatty-acyl-phospholipid synthase
MEIEGSLEGVVRLKAENSSALSYLNKIPSLPKLHKNTRNAQKKYIAHHYDLGNDFYKLWLDKSMLYSGAYYKTPMEQLETAQKNKVEHILKKLQLKKGQKLLDIGSGWGTLLIAAAKKYGVTGHGVTLSEEQFAFATDAAKKSGVAGKVTFEIANYQELPERGLAFDRVVSVGMFEHVGQGNHKDYYRAIDKLLKPDGLSVLHTITQQTELPCDPWIDKYIFPGGYIPSTREILHAFPHYNFRLTDYENLRIHYAMTLEEWQRRYQANKKKVIGMFDEKFYRMWDFWLACSAASFRYGELDLSQFVFTKGTQNELPLTRDF